jgi:hypothetical protein
LVTQTSSFLDFRFQNFNDALVLKSAAVGGIRDVDATIDTNLSKSGRSWRSATFDGDLKSEMIKSDEESPLNHRKVQKAVMKVPERWIAPTAVLEVMEYPFSDYQFLNQDAQLVNLESPTCTTTSVTFLS